MANVKALIADPDFQHLSPAGQKQVLTRVDPTFSGLSDEGLKSFLSQMAPKVSDRFATESLPKTLGGFQEAIQSSPNYHGHSDSPLLDSAKTAAGITGAVGLGLGGASAIAGATLKGFLTSLAIGTATGAGAGKVAKYLELPGWAQTAAEMIGGAAGMSSSGRLGSLIQEYAESRPKGPVSGFIDFLLNKNAKPEAEAITRLIHEPTGVTGGRPVPPTDPNQWRNGVPYNYPPGDPNAEPGPGLWQRDREYPGIIRPNDITGTPVEPFPSSPNRSLNEPSEPSPGFRGTRLPGPTGRGSNSQTPLPSVPSPRAIIEGPNPPKPSDYIFVGGDQYQIPGTKGVLEAPGPTGKVPSSPARPQWTKLPIVVMRRPKGSTKGSSTPLPAIPSAPPEELGVFHYGGESPTWEFKRTGAGAWGQRDFGTDQPFTMVGGSQALDLEDSLSSGELMRKK